MSTEYRHGNITDKGAARSTGIGTARSTGIGTARSTDMGTAGRSADMGTWEHH